MAGKIKSFIHMGYVLQQAANNHYLIIDGDSGKVCMHAACTEELTEETAKEHIEMYLRLRRDMLS